MRHTIFSRGGPNAGGQSAFVCWSRALPTPSPVRIGHASFRESRGTQKTHGRFSTNRPRSREPTCARNEGGSRDEIRSQKKGLIFSKKEGKRARENAPWSGPPCPSRGARTRRQPCTGRSPTRRATSRRTSPASAVRDEFVLFVSFFLVRIHSHTKGLMDSSRRAAPRGGRLVPKVVQNAVCVRRAFAARGCAEYLMTATAPFSSRDLPVPSCVFLSATLDTHISFSPSRPPTHHLGATSSLARVRRSLARRSARLPTAGRVILFLRNRHRSSSPSEQDARTHVFNIRANAFRYCDSYLSRVTSNWTMDQCSGKSRARVI